MNECNAKCFIESELEQAKIENPSYAAVIDGYTVDELYADYCEDGVCSTTTTFDPTAWIDDNNNKGDIPTLSPSVSPTVPWQNPLSAEGVTSMTAGGVVGIIMSTLICLFCCVWLCLFMRKRRLKSGKAKQDNFNTELSHEAHDGFDGTSPEINTNALHFSAKHNSLAGMSLTSLG